MNPEMAYFIRPCSLPQKPALAPCKTREAHRELSPQAFDIARFLGDDQHRGGSENEFSPCSQGAAGNLRGDELGGAAVIDVVSPRSDRLRRLLSEPYPGPQGWRVGSSSADDWVRPARSRQSGAWEAS